MKFIGTFSIFILIAMAACTPKVNQAIPAASSKDMKAEDEAMPMAIEPAKPYIIASIKTTPCYGHCPVYEAMLYSNGKAIYIGKKNTPRAGRFEIKVDKEVVKEVLDEAKTKGIFFLNDSYPSQRKLFIPDLPNTIISVSSGATPKVITNNHKAPKNLIDFENYLKGFFDGLDWGDK